MKSTLKIAAAVLCLGAALPAAAQQVDVAAITCADASTMPPEALGMMIAFIDGFTGGEAGDSVMDFDRLSADLDKVTEACKADASVTLMDAMKAALGQ